MMRLFRGHETAHGTHGATERNESKGGKLEIKKTARTVREPVTVELWEQHLSGDRPLGVVPIREDDTCLWGCIDVDRYDLDLGGTVAEIEQRQLPLVLCRTKSGGGHAYVFLSEPVSAEEMRTKLRQVAAGMGWGDCEIFPKQTRILSERGDLANWLNMPYLGGDATERYCVKKSQAAMMLSEFLRHAESMQMTAEEFLGTAVPEVQDESLEDGPPCLQHLAAVGFPEGTRNNGLFSLGVFCQKKFGQGWRDMLEKYNRLYMDPPLPSDEVVSLIRSLERTEYNYKCKDQPCVSYCNSVLCRTREFGVGGGGDYPTLSALSVLDTEPKLWFLSIGEERVELTSKQLQNYREFHLACMEQIMVCFQMLKQDTWHSMVQSVMENAVVIEAPPEASTLGHFMELLEDFCVNRHRGREKEDILLGKPWLSPEDDRHYFRLKDLMRFLDMHGFRQWGRNTVAERLGKMGGKHFFNIKGSGRNVFWVPDEFEQAEESTIPETDEAPI